jgi:hypothetical protein
LGTYEHEQVFVLGSGQHEVVADEREHEIEVGTHQAGHAGKILKITGFTITAR